MYNYPSYTIIHFDVTVPVDTMGNTVNIMMVMKIKNQFEKIVFSIC